MQRILGLDPGLRQTGWGILEVVDAQTLQPLSHGVIISPSSAPLAQRLGHIFQALCTIITTHKPTHAGVEETFVNQNPASALKLGMARGVVLLAPAHHNVEVAEYTANQVKKAVVGKGHASKEQVAQMVNMLLPQAQASQADAIDALAVAITHAHYLQTHQNWRALA